MHWKLLAFFLATMPLAAKALTIGPPVLTIDDIMSVDPLGFACIPSTYFDELDEDVAPVAFQVGGKVRLPRTCHPDPCRAALTKAELSGLTGTDLRTLRFDAEWEDYYVRYADYCRRETNPVETGTVSSTSSTNEDFWEPILARNTVGTGLKDTPDGVVTSTVFLENDGLDDLQTTNRTNLVVLSQEELVTSGGSTSQASDPVDEGTLTENAAAPTAISLPGSGPFLAASLLFGLFGFRKALNNNV